MFGRRSAFKMSLSEKENKNTWRAMEVFWTREDTEDNDTSLVHVAGLPDNCRPKKVKRVKGRKTAEVKANIPVKHPVVQDLTPQKHQDSRAVLQQMNGQTTADNYSQKASFKDLRAEDKKRVANLIRELARLGQEKETVIQQLETERSGYDKQVREFTEQQQTILIERQEVQKQLLECQRLLAEYQHRVLHQQEKTAPSPSKTKHQTEAVGSKETPTWLHYSKQVDSSKYTPLARQHSNLSTAAGDVAPPVDRNVAPPVGSHVAPPIIFDEPRLASVPLPQGPVIIPGPVPGFVHQDYHMTATAAGRLQNALPTHLSLPQHSHHSLWQTNPPPQQIVPPAPYGQVAGSHGNQSHSDPSELTGGDTRPFTNMIDQLIAEEKSKTPVKDKSLRGIGPLNEPVLSSTQRSDISEFRPLQPDGSSPRSDFSQPQSDQLLLNSLEEDHIRYLKTLNQDERKRHLIHQREALMAEQQRLQSILAEQERLLLAKQTQLHQQQARQRQRLAYFEETGHFPPGDWQATGVSNRLMTNDLEHDLEHDFDSVPSLDKTVDSGQSATWADELRRCTSSSTSSFDMHPTAKDTVMPGLRQHTADTVTVTPGFRQHTADTVMPGLRQHTADTVTPGLRQHTADTVTPGLRQHTADTVTVTPGLRQHTADTVTPGLRQHTADTVTPGLRQHTADTVTLTNKELRLAGTSSCRFDAVSNGPTPEQPYHAAALLDMVEEAERLRRVSRGQPRSYAWTAGNGYSGQSHNVSAHSLDSVSQGSDEDEESRVLEEVFFVR